MTHPPGIDTSAFPKRPRSGPKIHIEALIVLTSFQGPSVFKFFPVLQVLYICPGTGGYAVAAGTLFKASFGALLSMQFGNTPVYAVAFPRHYRDWPVRPKRDRMFVFVSGRD